MVNSINITVVSDTNRSIDIIKLDTNQIISSNFTNEKIPLPYDNYLIKINDINSNFSINNFFHIVDNQLLNDIIFIIFICIIFIGLGIFINWLKGR